MARDFDGITDQVDWGNFTSFDDISKMTISYFVKPVADSDQWGFHLAKLDPATQHGFAIQQWSTDETQLLLSFRNGSSSSWMRTGAGKVVKGRYNHLFVVYNGSETLSSDRVRMWIDGIPISLITNGAIPSTIGATTVSFFHGGLVESGIDRFSQLSLQEMGIWDGRAITDTAIISALANKFSPNNFPDKLVHYCDYVRDVFDHYRIGTPTITGTTVSHHLPGIRYPYTPIIGVPSAAAPASFIPYPLGRYSMNGGMQC